MLPAWLGMSLAALADLVNIFFPTPALTVEFRCHWWYWRHHNRLTAIWSRYRHLPQLRDYLFARLQLRL
jgi:hypothetical protein